jgi:hypothetical protein
VGNSVEEQETYRRRLFLSAFINDPYSLTTGRGNRAYLAAWTNTAPIDIELDGPPWTALDTTLYLVELEVEFDRPAGIALVPAELFTWTTESPAGFDTVAPFSLSLEADTEATFRYTPLPEVVLSEVQELIINFDRNATTDRTMPVQIWNWETGAWEALELVAGTQHLIRHPAPYLGPQNAVQLRVTADNIGSFQQVRDLTVEQRGRF